MNPLRLCPPRAPGVPNDDRDTALSVYRAKGLDILHGTPGLPARGLSGMAVRKGEGARQRVAVECQTLGSST
ncbi:MAG: hypothetical protein EBT09_04795 [Actinobacteria bacterium]|nr:hypothetical protein [Actinomycetota bacterium]